MSQNQVVLDHDKLTYHRFIEGWYLPTFFQVLGVGLILVACYHFWIFWLVSGAIFLIVGFLLVTPKYGIEIDTQLLRSRNIYSVFFIPIRKKWIKLKAPSYISVFGAKMTQSRILYMPGRVMPLARVGNSFSYKELQINIIHNRNKRLLVFKSDDLNELYAKADELSAQTGLRIHDALNRRP